MFARRLAWAWALSGVLAIVIHPIVKLAPIAQEALGSGLSVFEMVLTAVWIVFMAYSEGHKGFYRSFAPRVVSRSEHFLTDDTLRWYQMVLAPVYAMGMFWAPRRRMIVIWVLIFAIIILVLLVGLLNQPWRGIVDSGVVVGLSYGVLSILYFVVRSIQGQNATSRPAAATDT